MGFNKLIPHHTAPWGSLAAQKSCFVVFKAKAVRTYKALIQLQLQHSFQRPNRTKSASTKQLSSNEVGDYLDTIKIQIQGSHTDLSDNQLTLKQNVADVKHIHFQDSPEFYHDDDERTIPEFNVVVEPPSPQVTDELRTQRINDLRRHSSHSPSLSPREYDKDKDRRHSGINPNLLGLDSEHMKFLNCSPAASRRISCGSLFKVSRFFVWL